MAKSNTVNQLLHGLLLLLLCSLFLAAMSPIVAMAVPTSDEDENDTYLLSLSVNATVVDRTNSSIKSIQIGAQLLDKENNPVDEDDVPITFRTNASTFLENNQDEIVVNTSNGVAVVHLKPPREETVVRIRARIEGHGGYEAERFITVVTGTGSQGDASPNPGNDNPLNLPQVDLGGLWGVFEGNGLASSWVYPLTLVTILALLLVGFLYLMKRVVSWGSKKTLSAEIGFLTKLQAALIGVIGAVVTRSWLRRVDEHEVTNHPLRRRILILLERKGLVHLRELKRELQCSMSTLLWHLQVLEDFNYVKSVKHGQYIAYHLSEITPTPDMLTVYFALLNSTARKIIETMLSEQRMVSTRELERMTTLERTNIRYHLKKLSKMGIVVQRKEFNPPRYAIHPKYMDFIRTQLSDHVQLSPLQEPIDFDSVSMVNVGK